MADSINITNHGNCVIIEKEFKDQKAHEREADDRKVSERDDRDNEVRERKIYFIIKNTI